MKKEILGVKIDDINMIQAAETVLGWLKKSAKHYIVTPNPEIIMMAQKDQDLRNILNKADLSIPDGVGLKLSGKVQNTLPGVDLMERLVDLSAEKGFTIGLLGAGQGVAVRLSERLKKKYPNLKIVFAQSGGEVNQEGKVFKGLKLPNCDFLFVAFGPPKQEKWIANNLDKIPAHVVMAVGGSFDYLSGRIPRAPGWIRDLGFEWLFRLIIQPWRIKRQIALIKYLLMIL